MSIIADALKKAQEKRSERPDTSEMLFNKTPVPSLRTPCSQQRTAKVLNDKPQILLPNISLSEPRTLKLFIVIVAFLLVAGGGILASVLLQSDHGSSLDNKVQIPREMSASSAENNVISIYEKEPAASDERVSGRSYISPTQQKNLSLPVVSGIMYSPSNPQAIVNGILVSEGSMVDGFVLLEILPDNIKVRRGETEYQINLR
jgi:hypothetical protein